MPQISPPKKLKQARTSCTVTLTADEVAAAEKKVLADASKSVRIEGFRPGHAPETMVRERVGESALAEEVVRAVLPEVMQAILKEHAVKPVIPPNVEMQSRNPLTLVITFVERPDVTLKKAEKISIPKEEVTIEPKDIDRMTEYLRGQYRSIKSVDRAAKAEDEVILDFVGTMEGKEVDGTRAEGYRLVLGSKAFIPGFEDELIGLKKGEKKTFGVTFPTEYHAEALRGKAVEFSVTIHDVSEVITPPLTDDFVKEHHLGASVSELKTRIEESLRQQEDGRIRSDREQKLFEAIRAATHVELAPELLAHEQRAIFDELAGNLREREQNMDEWLKQTNRTVESFQKELQDESTKRLTLRFGIQQLMEDRTIEVSDADIQKEIDGIRESTPKNEWNEGQYKPGEDKFEELKWRMRVGKLMEMMLAQ